MEKKKKNKKETSNKKEASNEKNHKNLFAILGVIIVLLIIIIAVVYIINNKDSKEKINNNDETITNKNEGVIEDKEIEGLSLTKTSLIYKDGISTLETTVTNNTDTPYYLEEFHIIVKDENGNDIIHYTDEDGNVVNYLVGYAGLEIAPKESTGIETSIDFDISSDAYTISYEIVK